MSNGIGEGTSRGRDMGREGVMVIEVLENGKDLIEVVMGVGVKEGVRADVTIVAVVEAAV